MSYSQLLMLLAPECILMVAALAVLGVDLLAMKGAVERRRCGVAAAIAGMGCLMAIGWLGLVEQQGALVNGMLIVDTQTRLIKAALLVMTLFTIIFSMDADFTPHIGEYFALLLMGSVGMLFLISSEELLMIFVSLELTSLSLYILTAFNKQKVQSAEAALKYFLFGGMAAAFTVFGFSLVYGLAGSTNLRQISVELSQQGMSPGLLVALIMILAGFGFKVAAVPFHLWAPDTYEGAPTSSAAFIASGSKVASFFVLTKLMMTGFSGMAGSGAWGEWVAGWAPLLVIVAAFSILLGNLAALAQSSVKRLLAYSAVAHAGYTLVGILADSPQGMNSVMYYAITYALTSLGAFGIVAVIERATGNSRVSDFAGLSRRSPVLALAMMVFMLSLAGIPPLAGFAGKFFLFAAAARQSVGLMWLVAFAIGMSAVSLYYYLQVLKQIYVVAPEVEMKPLNASGVVIGAVAILALGVLILGCAPDLLLGRLALPGLALTR